MHRAFKPPPTQLPVTQAAGVAVIAPAVQCRVGGCDCSVQDLECTLVASRAAVLDAVPQLAVDKRISLRRSTYGGADAPRQSTCTPNVPSLPFVDTQKPTRLACLPAPETQQNTSHLLTTPETHTGN
jgi:hypothetical protein